MGQLGIAVRFIVFVVAFFSIGIAVVAPIAVPAAHAQSTTTLDNPLGNQPSDADISVLVGRVIKAGFGVVGAIALLMFVYGGFVWLTSSGSPDKVKKGQDTMVWAIFGVAVVFAAYAITSFIITALAG